MIEHSKYGVNSLFSREFVYLGVAWKMRTLAMHMSMSWKCQIWVKAELKPISSVWKKWINGSYLEARLSYTAKTQPGKRER